MISNKPLNYSLQQKDTDDEVKEHLTKNVHLLEKV